MGEVLRISYGAIIIINLFNLFLVRTTTYDYIRIVLYRVQIGKWSRLVLVLGLGLAE